MAVIKKIDVEMKDGEVIAIWYGCIMLPFQVTEASDYRAKNLEGCYRSMKNGDGEEFMDLLETRLNGVVNPSAKLSTKYQPPSDELDSRED